MTYEHVRREFPGMTYETMIDLRTQFQTYDLNHDGLVDFAEL